MIEPNASEPVFFTKRWVRCTKCKRSYAMRPPYKGARSKCCDVPVRSKLWGGWLLAEQHRIGVAEVEDRRARIAVVKRS